MNSFVQNLMERKSRNPRKEIKTSVINNSVFKEFILLFSLLTISLLFFYSIVHNVALEKQNIMDNLAFRYFRPLISDNHTRIANIITFFGTGTFLIPSYSLILFYLIRLNYHKYAGMVLTTVISSLLLGWFLKPTFHRLRPPYPLVSGAGGYSFPSGHALGGFIFTGVIIYLIWKTSKKIHFKCFMSILFAVFGLLIGLSRVYLHVHYITDIAGSLLVALIWLSLTYLCFRIAFKNSLHEKKEHFFPELDKRVENFHFLKHSE
jgi:undecaprenyl-diphosphatase